MKRKALLFSDLHAHSWTEFSTITKDGINSRLQDALDVLSVVALTANEHDIKTVIFAGDLFHRKRLIDVSVFNRIAAGIRSLATSDIERIYLIAGNHDLVSRAGDNTIASLESIDKVKIVTSKLVTKDGIGMLAYSDNIDVYKRGLEWLETKGAKAIITHMGISGAVSDSVEYSPLEPISGDDYPKVPVYSGHYHRPQAIGDHITYIGAPLQIIRGEAGKDRGFILMDTDRPKEQSRVLYPGPRIVVVNDEELEGEFDGNYIDYQTTQPDRAEGAVEKFKKWGARYVTVTPVAKAKAKEVRLKSSTLRKGEHMPTLDEMAKLYVENADTKLDKKKLLSKGLEYLANAE